MRESLGHATRDDALRFLAKHSASIVNDVKIIAESGAVERFPSRTDAAFYEGHMTVATLVAPKVEAVGIDRSQANNIMRLLNAANEGAVATLRALASRYQVAERGADELTVRTRLRELAERALSMIAAADGSVRTERPVVVFYVCEAWFVKRRIEPGESAESLAVEPSPSNHPDREEVVMIQAHCQDKTYMEQWPLVAGEGGRKSFVFKPMSMDGEFFGRLAIRPDATH